MDDNHVRRRFTGRSVYNRNMKSSLVFLGSASLQPLGLLG
jgi:hypothetical protein